MAIKTNTDDGGEEFEDSPPPLEDREVDPAVPDQDLEQTLEDLEASDPLGAEPPADATSEPPDVGEGLESELGGLEAGFSIPPAPDFGPEGPGIPPEPFDSTFIPPEVPEAEPAHESPQSLLEHFQRLAEQQPEADSGSEDFGLPEQELGDEAGGGGSLDDAVKQFTDSDGRFKDTVAQTLIDHARRIDDIIKLIERERL